MFSSMCRAPLERMLPLTTMSLTMPWTMAAPQISMIGKILELGVAATPMEWLHCSARILERYYSANECARCLLIAAILTMVGQTARSAAFTLLTVIAPREMWVQEI